MSLQTEREEALAQKAAVKEQASAALQVNTFRHNYELIKKFNSDGKTSCLMEYPQDEYEETIEDDTQLRVDLIKEFPELIITDGYGEYPTFPGFAEWPVYLMKNDTNRFSKRGGTAKGPLVKLNWA